MKVNRVSLSYKSLPVPMILAFAGWVISCMKGNAAFPNPPVPIEPPDPPDDSLPVDMTTRVATAQAALAAAEGGGVVQTAKKTAACEVVVHGLDALAFYVQTVARFDLPMLLTSGFQAVNTNRAQTQLDAPAIAGIDNTMSTQLDVHLTPITNAVGYEVQIRMDAADWKSVKFSTQARTITLTGLTTGTTYQVRARALGGSTGQSDWSAPSSKIVT